VADQRTIHWAQDEALLEEYVAGNGSAAQRAEFEAHAVDCDDCRLRVEDERLLRLGIQKSGREALRHELAREVARRSRPTAGVWRWMAAAAVLVVAAGIWRLNQPAGSDVAAPPTMTEAAPRPAPETSGEARGSDRVVTTLQDSERRSADRRALTTTPEETALERRSDLADASGAGVAKPAPQGVSAEMDDAVTEVEVSTDAPAVYWAVAVAVQSSSVANKQVTAPLGAARSDPREKELFIRQEAPAAPAQRGPVLMQVRQAPRADLPQEQQVQMRAAGQSSIPARLSLVGDSLLIELFPPTPYLDESLRRAVILRPSGDSVVVLIGRELLGLRIPKQLRAR
jgi:hypothetical protein